MNKQKKTASVFINAIMALPLLFVGCTTDDVEPSSIGGGENLVEISDKVLGEYLVYNSQRTDEERLPGGTAVEVDGKFYLDVEKAATAENLYLVKNETQIKKLSTAGLSTAAEKITNIDVLPYFTSLKTLKLTSNEIRAIDITRCPNIETIEMNNNLVSEMDMTNATNLKRFRYGSSADVDASCKLSSIDLSKCGSLEHFYLKNQNIGTDGLTLPENYSNLTEIDMSGNPGAPFPVPAALYGQLTTKNGVSEDNGDTPDVPDVPNVFYEIRDAAFGEYLDYLSRKGDLPEGIISTDEGKYLLNTEIAATVTVLNVAKTAKIITTLSEAGLSTAETLIASADGLQYFTSLTEFTATSNNFTSPLPLTALKNLEVLQINTAGVSSIDLSANTKIRVLNCNGSAKYAKLASIDLSSNTALETLNLKNNDLTTINLSGLVNLKEVDLSGNPGADFPIPAEIFNNLKTHKGVKSE